ncbi:MAG: pyridoxine 5'-phosphate synthase [Chitinophagaceae bacterium]|nr:MAG: pyridoxamine 5'-phosphate oxidase [Bacteroidetes bacterium OLB11]MCC6447659.1 pyridoxine 5'-phosphate synthase [Chitinophagaceae bacterium]HMN32354.1 pyridoxine 5'-phosphate synthase [Chitinophagaceae bacterium]
MTKLSVNINKVATLRNARGGNNPDVIKFAKDCELFGAEGITVHPRPDERHIRYEDVRQLKKIVQTELNIEGNPREKSFIDLVLEVKPNQVTLVPDDLNQITSNHGWDTKKNQSFLTEIVALFTKENIRVSIFIDPVEEMISHAKSTNTHRVELYTEEYAKQFHKNRQVAIKKYIHAANHAQSLNIELNAGHDLDLYNLAFFNLSIPFLKEVSIGHALISDSLYFGIQNTIQMYKRCLNPSQP